MEKKDLSREELFALLWEKPTTIVANEMGISDVALGKLCKKMQVPKPPRGYWARVSSGQTPKQPPLKAFIDEMVTGKHGKSKYSQLTELQEKFLKIAIKELQDAGEDVSGCEIKNGELRQISPDLASQVIVLMQNRFAQWLPEGASFRKVDGAQGAIGRVIQKLLPKARKHIVVIKVDSETRYWRNDESTLLLRVTPNLIQELTRMHFLVMDHRLEYVARGIQDFGHAWSCRYLSTPNGWSGMAEEVCVSASHFWVVCRNTDEHEKDKLETERMPISRLIPLELLVREFKILPPIVPEKQCRYYAERIKDLAQARRMFHTVWGKTFEIDRGELQNSFSVIQRLWQGSQETSPFDQALEQMKDLEDSMEFWELAIEEESERLCCDILGVSPGDDVQFISNGKNVRIRLHQASVDVSEKEVMFFLHGYRYRKDGLPGKREEALYLRVENDSGQF